MKLYFAMAVGLVLASTAGAVPVVNENRALTPMFTVFPDHADPNIYYLAPNYMAVTHREDGVPIFAYNEVRKDLLGFIKHGLIQTTFVGAWHREDLEEARTRILAANPAAQFVALPYSSSRTRFNEALRPYIENQFCTHPAGHLGDEQVCSFELNSRGNQIFISQLKASVFVTFNFEYSVDGFRRLPDGSFEASSNTWGIPARLDGSELLRYPELFRDHRGDVLRL